jgi:hypothetical protein
MKWAYNSEGLSWKGIIVISLPGSGIIQGIHKTQRGGPRGASRRQVSSEISPKLLIFVHSLQEHAFVYILEGKVERLRREIADYVGEISTPERTYSLLLWYPDERVHNTYWLTS